MAISSFRRPLHLGGVGSTPSRWNVWRGIKRLQSRKTAVAEAREREDEPGRIQRRKEQQRPYADEMIRGGGVSQENEKNSTTRGSANRASVGVKKT